MLGMFSLFSVFTLTFLAFLYVQPLPYLSFHRRPESQCSSSGSTCTWCRIDTASESRSHFHSDPYMTLWRNKLTPRYNSKTDSDEMNKLKFPFSGRKDEQKMYQSEKCFTFFSQNLCDKREQQDHPQLHVVSEVGENQTERVTMDCVLLITLCVSPPCLPTLSPLTPVYLTVLANSRSQ